ncbi:MAG: hypothetical protein LBU70_11090 [Chitinispirillales bacterium]|jgi:YVTN family beta-propeller protein|nr:hypothetical protein [Chitinispirillales bacterium]
MHKLYIFTAVIIGILTFSCIDTDDEPGDIPPYVTLIAVATSEFDFSVSNFDLISTEDYMDYHVISNLIDGLHTDLAIRAAGGGVYILERFGKDNVLKYNPKKMGVAYQQSIGAGGLNIQDIAVISETKAYISSLNSSDLIVFNPLIGKAVSTIDLSRFNAFVGTDSAEAHPFVSALARRGHYVYAACQRLKIGQTPFGPGPILGDTSLIAVIDTRTDEIVGEIRLNKKNPATMSIYGSMMLVASSGSWFDETMAMSGVEMINLASNTNLGVVVEGNDLSGNPNNILFVSPDRAYIGVSLSDWSVGIFPFNPVTSTVGAKIDGIGDGFGGMVYDGVKLYVGDRGFDSAGVVVVNPSTNTVERRIQTGMPPSALAVIFAD